MKIAAFVTGVNVQIELEQGSKTIFLQCVHVATFRHASGQKHHVVFVKKSQVEKVKERLSENLLINIQAWMTFPSIPAPAPVELNIVAIYTKDSEGGSIRLFGSLPFHVTHEDLPWINHPAGFIYDEEGNFSYADEQSNEDRNPYSIIPLAGQSGCYTLFLGRDHSRNRDGTRLAQLSDMNCVGEQLREKIVLALRAWDSPKYLQERLDELHRLNEEEEKAEAESDEE